MGEMQRRRPGRPRKEGRKEHITITLTLATIQYIDGQTENRSAFIEQCVSEHRERGTHKEK